MSDAVAGFGYLLAGLSALLWISTRPLVVPERGEHMSERWMAERNYGRWM